MSAWRYIKGSEKDFIGAPDWALYLAQVRSGSKTIEAWEGENNRYCYTPRSEGSEKPFVEWDAGGFISWGWSGKVEIIAQRERVTSINDDRLAQDMSRHMVVLQDNNPVDSSSRYSYVDGMMLRTTDGEWVKVNDSTYEKLKPFVPHNTEALITERGSRYGKFKDGAEIMRDLKHVMHEVDGWGKLTPSQKEALDMIQHKIGRILNGDPTYDDSWKDIAGYATLIVEELNGVNK